MIDTFATPKNIICLLACQDFGENMISKLAELLTNEQVESVHEASLEILENVGMLVCNQEARQRFVKHGCWKDVGTEIIKFPRKVVEDFRQAAPPTFTFYGRDPKFDRTIPDDAPLLVTGSSAPDITDLQTGEIQRSRSDDIARIAYLTQRIIRLRHLLYLSHRR